MLEGLIKLVFKTAIYAVLWVFILSIQWQGRTLFDQAHELLVQNSLVEQVDEELRGIWKRVYSSARVALQKTTGREDKIK